MLAHGNSSIFKAVIILLVFAIIFSFSACSTRSDMPFNGEVTFQEIALTVPEEFIRDSTQSTTDMWIFEQGMYTKYIIISRSNISGDILSSLNDYVDFMSEHGDSSLTTFLNNDAVLSVYTNNNEFCQEMLFAYNGSFYVIALREGTEEEFQSILDTVKIVDSSNSK